MKLRRPKIPFTWVHSLWFAVQVTPKQRRAMRCRARYYERLQSKAGSDSNSSAARPAEIEEEEETDFEAGAPSASTLADAAGTADGRREFSNSSIAAAGVFLGPDEPQTQCISNGVDRAKPAGNPSTGEAPLAWALAEVSGFPVPFPLNT